MIQKRDGTLVPYDINKIVQAIEKAQAEPLDARALACEIESQMTAADYSVEAVQDLVEATLIRHNLARTAKAYILYRQKHAELRNLMSIYSEMLHGDPDMKRENGNINGDSSMGAMLKFGSEASKYYTLRYVLPPAQAQAHISGDYHIHDLDFFLLTETCCQIDLLKLFRGGFSTGHGYLREPQSIRSAAALACIAVQANQNDMHGGQSLPAFDFFMAPYVRKSFERHVRSLTDSPNIIYDCLEYGLLPADKHLTYAAALVLKRAQQRTDEETYQAMEAAVHNFNTLNSRAGSQVEN